MLVKKFLSIASAALLYCSPVLAQGDYKNDSLSDWYKRLSIPYPNGTRYSCCDISDCHALVPPANDPDWKEPIKTEGGKWYFYKLGQWWEIPLSKFVTDMPNLAGVKVICYRLVDANGQWIKEGPNGYSYGFDYGNNGVPPTPIKVNIYCYVDDGAI
jgi:hypothetical protein